MGLSISTYLKFKENPCLLCPIHISCLAFLGLISWIMIRFPFNCPRVRLKAFILDICYRIYCMYLLMLFYDMQSPQSPRLIDIIYSVCPTSTWLSLIIKLFSHKLSLLFLWLLLYHLPIIVVVMPPPPLHRNNWRGLNFDVITEKERIIIKCHISLCLLKTLPRPTPTTPGFYACV